MFWLCLGITFCLTACQNAGQPETEVTVDFSALEGETAAPEGEKDEEEEAPVAAGWQLAPGYGICGPNQPAVYGLSPEIGVPVEKTEGADAELVSAFYQDGYMNVRIKVRDYSVTQIPDEEVNQKLQDGNGKPEWDNSYFCLDEEKQIYGRSAFLNKIREQAEGGKRETIQGTGICAAGSGM